MKRVIIIFSFLFTVNLFINAQTTSNDGDWKSNYSFLKNTEEAEYMLRIGDIDNLGFGWPADFNPFCGKKTPSHKYPWVINEQDLTGMDRILLGSSYQKKKSGDGYSGAYSPKTKPVPITIPLKDIKNISISAIKMQIFIDDFQTPSRKSSFKVTLNGKRFINLEKMIKAIDQTGPVGKLVTVEVNDELLPEFSKDSISFFVDDPTTGIGDGFAIDFIKILVNPQKELIYKGNIKGMVTYMGKPADSVEISIPGRPSITTDAKGSFAFNDIQPGLIVLHAYKKNFATIEKNVDVECSKTTTINIGLQLSKKLTYNGKEITEGESFIMSKIQFGAGSADLSNAAKTELDKIFTFLNTNKGVEIELDGFTSSEGEINFNKELSLKRVDACKKYLTDKGIEENRIYTIGYGPEKPIAPNDTETNRAKNRRVEMKVTKIK